MNKSDFLKENENKSELSNLDIYSIPSVQEKGIFYHIGIIDYLQLWNMQKRAEKLTKKVIMNKKDPSALEPVKYKERFIRLVNEIF